MNLRNRRNRRNRKAINRVLITSLLAAAVGLAHANAQAQDASEHHDATHGESEQPAGDTWITTKVKASLLANQDVSGLDISVETVNGVVTLTGEVDTQAEADRAVAVAGEIEGVTRVDASGITVRGGETARNER
ncbi:BON domain-containing protein [Luteimonas aestuarii]|uniref:Osmotically-inducible protein Y n=1 Tax=Luteimonas aestuarii TaxID=453837 RepID=A0A4R5TPU7_9GAMM|nr:BON domain-containing protein [Luteimonas aestuarii]TDK23224.1 BON domain-containing protein [Luteimonas aestuarii]